jgi:hypothetical protein
MTQVDTLGGTSRTRKGPCRYLKKHTKIKKIKENTPVTKRERTNQETNQKWH